MENYENENLTGQIPAQQPRQEEPAPQAEELRQTGAPYSGAGAGRKESPFADAPYEMPYQNKVYTEPARRDSEPSFDEPEENQKKSRGVWKGILAAVLALVLVAGSCGVTAFLVSEHWENEMDELEWEFDNKLNQIQTQLEAGTNDSGNKNVVSLNPVIMTGEGKTPAQIYAENVQSVVLIQSRMVSYSYGRQTTGMSTGSGFVVTADGYVVTNYHVVEGASAYTVIMHDGTEYDARLVGSDSTNDLAVLKVEAKGLKAVSIGSSDELIVGDQVVAIGNPLGELTSTMTVGYVSAKDRDVTTDGTTINMIQTDAAINSGNSGGPLFNTRGEVIGITTAKYSGSSGSGAAIEGIGFAIPMDDVIGMIEDLRVHGFVTGAYLGVSVYSVDEATAEMYNFPLGSLVDSIVEGSCSEKAGLKVKDIIIAIGDQKVTSNTDLTRALRKYDAGETASITVWRGGQEVTLSITFDQRPQTDPNVTQTQPSGQGQMPESGSYEEWYEYFAPFFGGGMG